MSNRIRGLLLKRTAGIISIEMTRAKPTRSRPEPDAARVLSRAMLRAAAVLEIAQAQLAEVIGVSPPTISRMASGQKALEEGSKPWQLAALFVRLFRSLDAIVGSDDTAARAWLRGQNLALGGVPLELIRDPAGLVRTVDYLDAARARI
jgi:transcriptional regulator with XRE-family HTH domain